MSLKRWVITLLIAILFVASRSNNLRAQEVFGNGQYWGSAEYLLWWMKGHDVPPLVTTGPTGGARFPGVLGQPGTQILVGSETLTPGTHSGGRFVAGLWIDDERMFGAEANYLFLGQLIKARSIGSSGNPALSIPFFNVTTGQEDTTGLANAPQFSGAAIASVSTRLQGAELIGVGNMIEESGVRLQPLLGFRWLNVDERFDFRTSSPTTTPPVSFFTEDRFATRNDFFGGTLGLRGDVTFWDVITVQASGKVSLGSMNQQTSIGGGLVTGGLLAAAGFVQSFPAGYFTAPTNRGTHDRSRFAVVPEANVNLSYAVRSWLTLTAGYSFIYISSVARPTDQLDRVLNPSQIPGISGQPATTVVGEARPSYPGSASSFWAHGVNLGVKVEF